MTSSIQRLLAPRSIALLGGAWADAVAAASQAIGYRGEIWRVHPKRPSTPETPYFRSIDELPGSPDATFVAAPNVEVPNIAAALARRKAGGFVCFAAGFAETATEQGARLTQELLTSAGDLPFFGPNCYGFVNFFDGAALWPDQVVGRRRERGVALICQSGTIALNLLFNDRSLPIGYVLTVGNQTRLAVEDMIELLCDDERVTAFGLYVEGIKDPDRFTRAVAKAHAAGKPIAMVKAGRTEAAARTARSHTGAMAGADTVFDAFCKQAGVARCDSLATLCETLKILHTGGPLQGRRVLIMGASGGDMAMTADAARDLRLDFAPIPAESVGRLRDILTDKVHIANPFDFHTHIWFDRPALRSMFSVAHRSGYDAVGFMLDCPPADQADPKAYVDAIEEFIAAHPTNGATRAAVISSLPESLAASSRELCLAAGIVPLQGQRQALEALDLAASIGGAWARGARVELRKPAGEPGGSVRTLAEPEGKAALAAFGVRVPASRTVSASEAPAAAEAIGFPVVIKATGAALEHKSEVGGVVVNIRTAAEARAAADRLARLSDRLLVEEMVADGVAEILIGMTVDPQFGQVLVLGAGGVLTELLHDTVSLLPPFTASAIRAALESLSINKLLTGFRGRPPGDIAALVETALACTRYAEANVERLVELDINPVIVRPDGRGAVAVDALIRLAEES
ncbi:MAG TPA: acetate--CoA ligase family protein [Steroidobacteraceae bacterium]|nr:acetate--CoA ligase family protein [Steroidobacteraceae bacterium]